MGTISRRAHAVKSISLPPEEINRRKKAFLWSPFADNTPPDSVNEVDIKFWFDPSLTDWATSEQAGWSGIMPSLKGAIVYVVEFPNGEKTRILTISGQIVDESSSYEGMAVCIDKHKVIAKMS